MNILVTTGRMAEKAVRKAVQDKADILVVDIDVASFITPALLRRYLQNRKYDIILIPGLATGDFSGLEKELNTPFRLGPKHAIDLGFVLHFADEVPFSKTIPACELLIEKRRTDAFEKVNRLEKEKTAPLVVRGVKLGGDSRMKVMAEIVDAGHLSRDELTGKIQYFEHLGADIIDLGMSLGTGPEDAKMCVETARSTTGIPLSIDTLEPHLINTALDSGIDMVLSLNSRNINEVKENIIRYSAAAVVIPDARNDPESLFRNIRLARDAGIENIIADPVLEPLGYGFAGSINRYHAFREKDRTVPLFFGVGNVTELIDADSIGINAMLAGIAMELDANILFTPDFSHKAHNCVSELKTASSMMMLARERESSPKDLGIDLLVIKEKRRREFGKHPDVYFEAKSGEHWHPDPAGFFKIEITREEIKDGEFIPGKITARHKNNIIVGTTAKEVIDTIIEMGFVSRLDHAAYLGRELMKAELALKFKRSYSQDDRF